MEFTTKALLIFDPIILLHMFFLKILDFNILRNILSWISNLIFLLQQKQDESLLEDVWTLLRAGRLEEACDLCRSAGQVCDLPSVNSWTTTFYFFCIILIHDSFC